MSSTTVETGGNVDVNGGPVDGSGAAGGAAGIEIDSRDPVGPWELVSLKLPGVEAPVMAAGIMATMEFMVDGSFSGKICNNISGSYSMNGNQMTATNVISTKMFCEGAAGEIETAFLTDVSVAMGVSRTGEMLVLNGPTGNVYTFSRVAAE
jgi:heat shock protein HslJ